MCGGHKQRIDGAANMAEKEVPVQPPICLHMTDGGLDGRSSFQLPPHGGGKQEDGTFSNPLFALHGVQSVHNGPERQDQAERAAVEQRHCSETLVPARGFLVLGVDSQRHPADLSRYGKRP